MLLCSKMDKILLNDNSRKCLILSTQCLILSIYDMNRCQYSFLTCRTSLEIHFLSCFPPFYTTTIIQLSRCPYLQLITRSIILLFLHFIENSQNWQKLPMMIEFARATEWILYLTLHIQSRYKIKNLAKILAPEYIFLKILVFFNQNKGKTNESLLLFLK